MSSSSPELLPRQPISCLRGVGPKIAARLEKLGIDTVQDLLFHLPLRYQDRTQVTPIGALDPGSEVLIEGEVHGASIALGRRRSLVCQLGDTTGTVTLRFFHFNAQQQRQLERGTWLRCYGEVRRGSTGLELYHPEYRRLSEPAPLEERLTPVYPATEGVNQAAWRRLISQALSMADRAPPPELLPPDTLPSGLTLMEALGYLHAPPRTATLPALMDGGHPARQRLAMEELLAHQLALLRLRQQARSQAAPIMPAATEARARLLQRLPFALTGAQQRVAAEIREDLSSGRPMLRLLQGDVGSGKTLVAALTALQAVAAGYQAVIMAPTEILAEQHLNSFHDWFTPLGVELAWLVGRVKGRARSSTLEKIASGQAGIAIGTHALFQDDVHFARLGLLIVDEQHRFGVHQRLLLRNKGRRDPWLPHQLTMTATPIPRTLAMTAYTDLDSSVIDELPPGRTPVTTVAVPVGRRGEVIERVRLACQGGQQVYWVCTLIEESEQLQAQAAQATAAELTRALPGIGVGLVHGRLKPAEKASAMAAFKSAQLSVLVATTVIEVGVDVPNASLMVIENPERLGLAQLHQLRGRVGRGSTASHCVLLYQSPLSRTGRARLQAMRESNDGFAIAERDLELRGPGEVLGTRQTGMLTFRIADLQRDRPLIENVRALATRILAERPDLIEPLIRRWLPRGQAFADV